MKRPHRWRMLKGAVVGGIVAAVFLAPTGMGWDFFLLGFIVGAIVGVLLDVADMTRH